MNECKGFLFSLDAIISLGLIMLVSISIVFSAADYKSSSCELIAVQKQHDLLKHWMHSNASEKEIAEQFILLFGESSGVIEVNGKTVFSKKPFNAGNAISSSAEIFNHKLESKRITLTVFC